MKAAATAEARTFEIPRLSRSLTLGHCLLFAALISPTDPVATLSVLREVHAPPILRNCIFGEATLNDALSIVVFHVIRKHFRTPLSPRSNRESGCRPASLYVRCCCPASLHVRCC